MGKPDSDEDNVNETDNAEVKISYENCFDLDDLIPRLVEEEVAKSTPLPEITRTQSVTTEVITTPCISTVGKADSLKTNVTSESEIDAKVFKTMSSFNGMPIITMINTVRITMPGCNDASLTDLVTVEAVREIPKCEIINDLMASYEEDILRRALGQVSFIYVLKLKV